MKDQAGQRGCLRHSCKYGGCQVRFFPTSNDNCPPESFVKSEVKSRGSKCHGAHCSWTRRGQWPTACHRTGNGGPGQL